ncbi:MAG: rRNA maturation RNase YbeY [Planctomycetota bacterium]
MTDRNDVPSFDLDVVDDVGLDLAELGLEAVVSAVLGQARSAFEAGSMLEISLLITGDDGIAELHGQFLDDPTETDVMSFETDETSFDLVVNRQRAVRESQARGVDADTELLLYVAHGLLHCVGYDDHDEKDRREMRAAERRVMTELGRTIAPVDEDDALD